MRTHPNVDTKLGFCSMIVLSTLIAICACAGPRPHEDQADAPPATTVSDDRVVQIGDSVLEFSMGNGNLVNTPSPPEPPAVTTATVSDDRIVLLGNTIIERAIRHGYLDLAMTITWPTGAPEVRNLGWSGDTVFGDARSYFGPPEEGFQRLTAHLEEIRPTIALVAYGAVASFEGKDGLQRFGEGLEILVKLVQSMDARVMLVTPTPLEALGPPLPDPTRHNEDVDLYAEFIRDFAEQRQLDVIDLHAAVLAHMTTGDGQLTDNGMHFNEFGYWLLARDLATALGVSLSDWHVNIDARNANVEAVGTNVEKLESQSSSLAFTTRDTHLPLSPPPPDARSEACALAGRTLQVSGLSDGLHTLRVDGKEIMTAQADVWAQGVHLWFAPEFKHAEALRKKILEKSRLWFHRWRPQNETYLRGFRKHEQGEHAVEIGQFDPLIAAIEDEIAKLRVPIPHRYELVKEAK
jgi:lysophospholipase L1-like esterase